jgi:hypothetical protein
MESSKIHFIASVNENSIDGIQEIAKRLKQLGCSIDNVLSFSGVITGSTASNMSLDDLKIDGIKNVEADRKVKAIHK